MSTPENPPAESPSKPRVNPCFGVDAAVIALDVLADDGVSYLLPYAQFLYAERTPNPALEKEADAPPEKLLLRFASGDVVLLGSGFAWLVKMFQRHELRFVKSADRRLAAVLNLYIAAVTFTLTKETL
jgi:hypothetical protein